MKLPGEEKLVAGKSNAFKVFEGNDDFTLETVNTLFVQDGYISWWRIS